MDLRKLAIIIAMGLSACDFGPMPLKLGQAPKTNPDGTLSIPMNVGRAFAPTGYFYNVWPPADTTFTIVDPEKWNNFLAYQSIYLHPACRDRVAKDTLVKYDSALSELTTPTGFYSDFDCSQFTYSPVSGDDLYGGVFWLKGNNFGNHPGVRVKGGARKVKFWARSLSGNQSVMFGVGVANFSSLKPWFYFTPFADEWGTTSPIKTAIFEKRTTTDPGTGIKKDTVVVKDSVPEGSYYSEFFNLNEKWKLFSLNLIQLYGFSRHPDGSPYDSLPDHNLIGAFYWAIESNKITDTSHVTAPIRLSDGTMRQVHFGAATILIDGIRYE